MSRMLRYLGYLLAAVLAGYFLWIVGRTLDRSLLAALAQPAILASIVVAALLYALIIPITAWAWTQLLARQGERWRWQPLAILMGCVQLAKYIPGNVAQHAGRAILAMRAGMGGRVLTVTVLQETLLAVAASFLVGAVMLALSAPVLAQVPVESRIWLLAVAVAVGTGALALAVFDLPPKELQASPSRVARLLGMLGGFPGPSVVMKAMLAYSINYVLIGLGLWLVARAAGLPAILDFPLVTAVFALSWLLGFLAPGMPAGLGVREGIMLLLLSGVVAGPEAIGFVLLARVVTMLGDGICYLASWFAPGSLGPAKGEGP